MKTLGKKALLVGTNTYDDSKLSNLKFSVNDASSIYEILTDPKRGGFNPDNCLLMIDRRRKKNLKPIRSNLMSSITSLSRTAKPDDYILFFFSGHGIEEDEKPYLLPSDARINVLRDTAVSIDWIKTTLKASKAYAKVLILDACHAGAMKGKSESGRMTKGLHDSLFPATEGFAVLSSCKLHEVSYEMPEKKHSVFSYFLIEGLRGAADFDSDGRIMISDASRYTADRTMEWSYRENVQQTPNLDSQVVGDLMLVSVPRLEDMKIPEKIEKVTQDFSDLALPISTVELFPGFLSSPEREELRANFSSFLAVYLLNFFTISEIKYSKGSYVFPLGEVEEHYPRLALKYYLDKIAAIDEMFVRSAGILEPRVVLYYSQSLLDINKIAKLLKVKEWKPLSYDPKNLKFGEDAPVQPFLDIEPNFSGLKQTLMVRFYYAIKRRNGKYESVIQILSSKKNEKLDEKSIQFARPTNFLKLVGNIWKNK